MLFSYFLGGIFSLVNFVDFFLIFLKTQALVSYKISLIKKKCSCDYKLNDAIIVIHVSEVIKFKGW